jgi:predicted nucleic acid-binding protein
LIAYADTGFLVSLYGRDDNTTAALSLTKSRPIFFLTPLGEAEFCNALELRVFRKDWTRRQAREVRDAFLRHQASGLFRMEPLTPEIWELTTTLSRRNSARLGTRTLDLLHIATALILKPDAFYTFDERQRRLAKSERLAILPN